MGLEIRATDGGVMVWRARCPVCEWVGFERAGEFGASQDLASHVDAVHPFGPE